MDTKALPQMPDELLMLVGAMCHVRGEAEAKQAATKLQAWGAACYAAGMDRAAQYRQAIDDELVTIESTVDTYPDARAAVRALIDWHVMVALDPAVSSDARALVHRGMDRAAEVCDTLKMGRPGHSAAHDVVLYRGDCADAIRAAKVESAPPAAKPGE